MPKVSKLANQKTELTGQSVKYRTDILLKSRELSGYQKDFAKSLLIEPEYTVDEAKRILDQFFGEKGKR